MIVTHNLQQAHRVADQVAFMYLGDLVEYGIAVPGVRRAPGRAHLRVRQRGLRVRAGLLLAFSLLVLGGSVFAACQSTQDESAELAKHRDKLLKAEGLEINQESSTVTVVR